MIILTDNGPVEVGGDTETPGPSQTPGGVAQGRPQMGFTWVGSDGVEWDLVRGDVGLLTGARGFGFPTPQHWLKQGLDDGAWWDGLRYPPRDVYLPVEVTGDIPAVERAFFAGLNPRTRGVLRVTQPDTQWRELGCRYTEGAEGEYEIDPYLSSGVTHGIRAIAEDVFWTGEPVTDKFDYPSAAPSKWGQGPPVRLAPSNILGASTLTNPGEAEASFVGQVLGPFTGFTITIGDALVDIPDLTKTAGQWVEIDMNPGRLTVLDETGADLQDAGLVADVVFEGLPPGEVAVNATVAGASPGTSVHVSFTPRYLRAW